ncbi:unnamed protein product [Rhizophagus irregularis]|nr:unnamed protein product [Rhizophagus irregularis]CAB5355177.1 unnamed protein product [Rhizophagus irregularis]
MLFLCLIVIYLYLDEFTLAFTPKIVWGHSAVFADSRIYITGGIIPISQDSFKGEHSKEFYYLNVGKPFGVEAGDKLPWVDLSPVSQILPTHAWSAFSNCGDSLILYIGESNGSVEYGDVYTYNLQQWNNLMTINSPPSYYHSRSQTVCDKTGKMYRFGGNFQPIGNPVINNKMNILDIHTRVWRSSGAPVGMYDHTGTLLPNGYIVYIGGRFNELLVNMSKLLLYNINDNTWTPKKTFGDTPTSRAYHSAVLTQDGRIIVYGGIDDTAADDLVILDTSQANFTWSIANVSTKSPLLRTYHTATLVGHYMIVIFGKNNEFISPTTQNEVFILDTSDKSNYKWISKFDPNLILPTSPTTPDQNLSTRNRNLVIIILSIVLALIGASFLIYFYRKRRLLRTDMFVHFPQIN